MPGYGYHILQILTGLYEDSTIVADPNGNIVERLKAIATQSTNIGNIEAILAGIYDSSLAVADANGNLVQLVKYVSSQIAGAPPIRVIQSDSDSVVIDAFSPFTVSLYDGTAVPFAAADIDITTATLVLEKSHLGGAFSAVGIPQPTLAKTLGAMYANHFFINTSWEDGDSYRLTLAGAKITSLAVTLQTFIWQGLTNTAAAVDADVAIIKAAVIAPGIDDIEDTTVAHTVGHKGDSANSTSVASSMGLLRNLISGGLCRRLKVKAVNNSTHFTTDSAFPAISDSYNGWYVEVLRSTTAPMGEIKLIADWTNPAGTGTVEHAAFTSDLTAGDSVAFIHPLIYNTFLIKTETDKIPAEVVKTAAIKTETDKIPAEIVKTAAIKVETDKLPATIVKIDAEVVKTAAVKVETDKIPATIVKIDAEVIKTAAIKVETDKIPATIVTLGLVKTETDKIAAGLVGLGLVKAETDKIAGEVVKTTAIRAETDKIPSLKTETDKIPATIAKIDLIKVETDKVPATIVKIDAEVIKTASIKVETDKIPGTITKIDNIKIETDKIPATIVKIDDIKASTTYRQYVYPTLTAGVIVNGGVGAWGLSAAVTEIIPTNAIGAAFKLIGINISQISANDTYELVLYSGTAGNEVEIGRKRFTKIATGNMPPMMFKTESLPANTRVSAKLASASGGDNITLATEYIFG